MATAASAAVSVGMSPSGRTSLSRDIPETEIEELISDQLVGGCVLMDKSCPACVTPLLKQMDELPVEPHDDASLKKGKSKDTTKSSLSLVPIDGVPFCVACQAHVVTCNDEVEKVEKQKQTLQDMVLTALALEDEPLFVCGNPTRQALLEEMVEEAKPSSKKSTKSQTIRRKRLEFEFADGGDVEVVRAKSSFSTTPKQSFSQTSRKTGRSIRSMQASIQEVAEEQREDENVTKEKGGKTDVKKQGETLEGDGTGVETRIVAHDEECHEMEITITPDLVDKTPESGKSNSPASSIEEIDVNRDCSVDAEELTADFLTLAESEDEWLSYEEK